MALMTQSQYIIYIQTDYFVGGILMMKTFLDMSDDGHVDSQAPRPLDQIIQLPAHNADKYST